MHVAEQIFTASFEATRAGVQSSPAEVFPDWDRNEALGVIIEAPLAALGASLMIQLAIAQFYDASPDRRSSAPTYPEIYLFHVGGPHGDFSFFDFWPPRKEVFLKKDQPLELLESVNSHRITRLLVPGGPVAPLHDLRTGASPWAEIAAAQERIKTTYQYSGSGQVHSPTVELATTDPRLLENMRDALDPARSVHSINEMMENDAATYQYNDETADDFRWARRVMERVAEVPVVLREQFSQRFEDRLTTQQGRHCENYRELSTEEALGRMASIN